MDAATVRIGVGTRRLLIVCEVALSLVLLMGAGVMVQSLVGKVRTDPGRAVAGAPGYVLEEPNRYTFQSAIEYLELIGRLRKLPPALLTRKIGELSTRHEVRRPDPCQQPAPTWTATEDGIRLLDDRSWL